MELPTAETSIPLFIKFAREHNLNSELFYAHAKPESFLFRPIIPNEQIHKITFAKPLEMQATPFTQLQAFLITGQNKSEFKSKIHKDQSINVKNKNNQNVVLSPNHPAESYSWVEVQQIIEKMNSEDQFYRYRLPTEEEWLYAASKELEMLSKKRLKPSTHFWIQENSEGHTQAVAQLRANELGLFDMIGNVYVWLANPVQNTNQTKSVVRGGSWAINQNQLRQSTKLHEDPSNRLNDVGFRLVREPLQNN